MILDELENLSLYSHLAPKVWDRITRFLSNCSPETPPGRYELEGNRVYALVQEYETHPADSAKLEIHRNYTDIQLLIAGEESIFYSPVKGLEVTQEYDTAKDIAFFRMDLQRATPLPLYPGNFAVFLPGEGHMPGVACPGELYCAECPGYENLPVPEVQPVKVTKIVVKIQTLPA